MIVWVPESGFDCPLLLKETVLGASNYGVSGTKENLDPAGLRKNIILFEYYDYTKDVAVGLLW